MPTLLNTVTFQPDFRIIVTSSDGYHFHASEGIAFPDLRTTQLNLSLLSFLGGKDSWRRYSQSKLANIVYTVELVRRCPSIKFVAVHPGVCETKMTLGWSKGSTISRKVFASEGLKSAEEGSYNQLWAATGNDVINGEYYALVGIFGHRTPKSEDEKLRGEQWEWKEMKLKTWTFEIICSCWDR